MLKKIVLIIFGILILILSWQIITKVTKYEAKVETVKVNDATIAYYTRGKGDPIILLPGFAMTMQHWDPLFIESLSKTNKVIILDYRGVGISTGRVEGITPEDMANDVIGVMDTLKIEKAHILGWSLGSFVAQVIAEEHPERVRKLILVSTAPGGDKTIPASESISKTIDSNISGTWNEVFVPYLFYSEDKKQAYLKRLAAAQKAKNIPVVPEEAENAKIAQGKAFANAEYEKKRYDKLSSISMPTLLITGEQDELLVPENAEIVKAQIPGAELEIIPEAGHAVLFEKPEEMTKRIVEFIY